MFGFKIINSTSSFKGNRIIHNNTFIVKIIVLIALITFTAFSINTKVNASDSNEGGFHKVELSNVQFISNKDHDYSNLKTKITKDKKLIATASKNDTAGSYNVKGVQNGIDYI